MGTWENALISCKYLGLIFKKNRVVKKGIFRCPRLLEAFFRDFSRKNGYKFRGQRKIIYFFTTLLPHVAGYRKFDTDHVIIIIA